MKKKLLPVLLLLVLTSLLCLPVSAASLSNEDFDPYNFDEAITLPRLNDMAGLFGYEDELRLASLLDAVSSRHDFDVVIVTTNTLYGMSPRDFSEHYYDNYGFRPNGILFMISMEDRDMYVSASLGYASAVFSDAGIDYMVDRLVPDLSDGHYALAADTFIELSEDFLVRAETGEPYTEKTLPRGPMPRAALWISAVVGLLTALIGTGRMKAKLRSVRPATSAESYVTDGSLSLRYERDVFLYKTLDRTKKESSSSSRSGGGGGRSGGGSKF